MGKFIKRYALEIYTVLAMMFMVVTAFMGNLSTIQRFVVVLNFLFILHEWEEGVYPGGFVDLISSLIDKDVSAETKKASRIPTGVLLITLTLLPFIFDKTPLFAVSIAVFACMEGFVHIMGIKIFGLKKKYTPGMVTAELEAVVGIALIVYLAVNHLAAWYDYVGGFFLFIALFACMQKTLTMMVGIRYRDMPKLIRKQLQQRRREKAV
ncbi:MAG: HXXEE domain-containing protein [Bacteroidaceae bacterium]|nr:HXXEE domain-containing protein [Bacteroidaceae bacterium]